MTPYRSRLQKIEQRKDRKKATMYFLGSIAVIIALIIWGVPLIVKISSLVIGLGNSGKPIDSNDYIPPGPPTVVVPYTATNSASLSLWGIAEPGSIVYLLQNKDNSGNVVTKDDGTFNFSKITLKDGNNEFTAIAKDKAGNQSQPSKSVSVYFSNREPKLDVEMPKDRQSFSGNPRIEIKGSTEPGTRVYVNDRVIIVNSDGKFSSFYGINPGDNTLVFIAMDKSGNITRKEMVVTFNP